MSMHEHVLAGCRTVPLAHYLKALGVLRLVTEQADPDARGRWSDTGFVLTTRLSRESMLDYFLTGYAPTPIVAPWNGGSGFSPKDNKTGIDALRLSKADRFSSYKETIDSAVELLERLGIDEKVSGDQKPTLLEACRGWLPEAAVPWLDAAFVLSLDGARFPPLLGTGGNDGRLDFSNNYMQRLIELIDPTDGIARSGASESLEAAIFDEPTSSLLKNAAIGQFLPGDAGGANATSGFDADSLINRWDFILMLEGALMFGAAATRRLTSTSDGSYAYPFTVRSVAVGYGSASSWDEQNSRAEMWLPVWDRPCRLGELKVLLSEGRVRLGRRPARNGIDFARAIASLGVDRGVSAFERIGFQVRNGLSYFATPLGRIEVQERPLTGLLRQLDVWLDTFRSKATSDRAPATVRRAQRRLEGAVLELCGRGEPAQLREVLVSLGECERVLARSFRWSKENISPIPLLSPRWLDHVDDGSPEFRLAAGLASVFLPRPVRRNFEPIAAGRRPTWAKEVDKDVVWHDGDIVSVLNSIMARRILLGEAHNHRFFADRGMRLCPLSDVARFVLGLVDEQRFSEYAWALLLVDWSRADKASVYDVEDEPAPALYGLLKLCFAGMKVREVAVPLVPQIHRLAAAGNAIGASRAASRRLRGSGLVPAVDVVHSGPKLAARAAAALVFPVSGVTLRYLARHVLRRDEQQFSVSDKNNQGEALR